MRTCHALITISPNKHVYFADQLDIYICDGNKLGFKLPYIISSHFNLHFSLDKTKKKSNILQSKCN